MSHHQTDNTTSSFNVTPSTIHCHKWIAPLPQCSSTNPTSNYPITLQIATPSLNTDGLNPIHKYWANWAPDPPSFDTSVETRHALVLLPLLVDVEQGEVVTLGNLELLPCRVRVLLPSLWPVEYDGHGQHGHDDLEHTDSKLQSNLAMGSLVTQLSHKHSHPIRVRTPLKFKAIQEFSMLLEKEIIQDS